MQVILAAMGGGAPGTMTAECAGALAAAECVVDAAAAGRAARGLHGAQRWKRRPQEVLRACWKRGDTPPCALWRTAAAGFIPARAACAAAAAGGKRRCGAGAAGYFQRAAFGRASGPPWRDWTLVSAHGAACDAAAAV